MSSSFEGQVAVITGGASGLGLAIAKKLHGEGATVALLDLSADAAQAAAKEVGANAAGFGVNVTDEG